jgi:Fur family ferric uptake transcriptional regulator
MDDRRAQAILERLRGRGVRLTAPRVAVVDALVRAPAHHVTAGDLVDQLRRQDPTFHESTVYRSLERLVEAGVVTRIEVDAGPVVYHLARDPHHHVVCDRCGRVIGVPADLLDDVARALRDTHGFALRADAVTLPGRCLVCPAPGPSGGPARSGPALAHEH